MKELEVTNKPTVLVDLNQATILTRVEYSSFKSITVAD